MAHVLIVMVVKEMVFSKDLIVLNEFLDTQMCLAKHYKSDIVMLIISKGLYNKILFLDQDDVINSIYQDYLSYKKPLVEE